MSVSKENDEGACINTDKEIWRKVKDDYYSPRIYVTKQNGITFCVGGNCVTKSIEDWFFLATPTFSGEKEGYLSKEAQEKFTEYKKNNFKHIKLELPTEQKEYCECNGSPETYVLRIDGVHCLTCEKLKPPKKWNEPTDKHTHLTVNADGTDHYGEGNAKDCKICNPPIPAEKKECDPRKECKCVYCERWVNGADKYYCDLPKPEPKPKERIELIDPNNCDLIGKINEIIQRINERER